MINTGVAQDKLAIEVKGLSKTFGAETALTSIDIQVEKGEAVVIFGPNGAGKTTLIKILATIMNPSEGEVLVNGLNLRKNAEEILRSIGVITHNTFLYNNLTAYENLKFYGRMYDVPNIKDRIHEVVARFDMTPRLHDRVGNLSRGMQQRFSISRALLHNPKILLLDEPETGLDQQAISILSEVMRDIEQRTIILTTHSLERGLELSDRLIILNKGRIAYESSTLTLNLSNLAEVYHQHTKVKV